MELNLIEHPRIQGKHAKYVELSNQTYGLTVETLASATRSRFDYWKSVWKIAARLCAVTAIDVRENFDRASERLASLTVGELRSRVQRTADFSEQFLAQIGRLQDAAIETYRDSERAMLQLRLALVGDVLDAREHGDGTPVRIGDRVDTTSDDAHHAIRPNDAELLVRVIPHQRAIAFEDALAIVGMHPLEVCFARAFESTPFGMSLVSARPESLGRYLQANQAYCEMVGYPQEDLLTMPVSSVVHPDDAEHYAEVVHDLSVGRATAIECESRLLHRDGSVIWVRQRRSLVRDYSGRPCYIFSHSEDVTRRKIEQAALADAPSGYTTASRMHRSRWWCSALIPPIPAAISK